MFVCGISGNPDGIPMSNLWVIMKNCAFMYDKTLMHYGVKSKFIVGVAGL